MRRRTVFAFAVLVLLALAGASLSSQSTDRRARKYKAPPPTGRIEVTVVNDVNGKPIMNAAVIFHPMAGEKSEGTMELKTNEDGKTVIDVIPIGDTLRLQIIAKGFQTFGNDYKIDKDSITVSIRLKRPGEQYSVYKHHSDQNNDQSKPQNDNAKPQDKPPDSSKPN
jgi:5-hydroxyisourate hydrolase-like protein (transthyretin family)